jgi:hypothetical protein
MTCANVLRPSSDTNFDMVKYTRITIEPLQRGDRTEWRVTAWVSDNERTVMAYCPTKEMAETVKQALMGTGGKAEPAKT